MKKIFVIALAFAVVLFSAFTIADPVTLTIGTKAPKTDLKMTDISGRPLSLNEMKRENGLLVIFSCNTCPFVIGSGEETEGWEGRYDELKTYCDQNKVGMVLVNSNEAKREKGDNLDDMKARAKEKGFGGVHYVLDKNSELADAFGARTTPHVFLFDKTLTLSYTGAIDDNVDSAEKVKENWLKNAIANQVAGKKINPAETKATGCSIKRVVPQ